MDGILKYFTTFGTNPKENSRHMTSFIILVLIFFYAYTFFDVIISENKFISNALLLVLFFLIKSIISDHDPLYSGNPKKNKYTKCFQKTLPSKYIMETYSVDMKEAKSLWYNVFNKWSDKENEMHYNWETSLRRGFKCRMVHFTIKSFGFVFLLSLITILLIWFVNSFGIKFRSEIIDLYFIEHKNIVVPIIFTISCLVIYGIFKIINYPNEVNPKGCFLRFNEINNLNIDWLRQNIRSKEDFISYGKKDNNNA